MGVVLRCNAYEVLDLGVMVPCETILNQAREHKVLAIGLSGLITPSLDEMVHVAREMKRQGLTIPLLIGGATTSRAHTSVKIAPCYGEPSVHVKDASRVIGVMQKLLDPNVANTYRADLEREHEELRVRHKASQASTVYLSLEEARANRLQVDWEDAPIAEPEFLGVRTEINIPIEEIEPFIDWTPFFSTWELKGVYPKIFEDAHVGERARELFKDAQQLLRSLADNGHIQASAVHGFFAAQTVGDDILLYADRECTQPLGRLPALRQQFKRAENLPNLALSDFIAPASSGRVDYLGAFAVTAGHGLDQVCRQFEAMHDDYSSIMAKALADRLAEALAEKLHQQVRREWGYGRDEKLSMTDLIKERYRGIRPAPGYPASPDHLPKQLLWDLLGVEAATGITLTESLAMLPASSVSGFYFASPEARYFAVGKLAKDQLVDYAARMNISVEQAERWLSYHLGYEHEPELALEGSAR